MCPEEIDSRRPRSMIASLRQHSDRRAAETEESNAQGGGEKREGLDSQRGSIQHNPMLDAIESPVKGY
jgi:hypothetical protein